MYVERKRKCEKQTIAQARIIFEGREELGRDAEERKINTQGSAANVGVE